MLYVLVLVSDTVIYNIIANIHLTTSHVTLWFEMYIVQALSQHISELEKTIEQMTIEMVSSSFPTQYIDPAL